MLLRILNFVAVVALATPALAADLSQPAPVPAMAAAPNFNWAGPYLGANAGGASGHLDWTYTDVPGNFANQATGGGLAGVTAGFNVQRGLWVWGLEGDVDWANINGTTSCPSPAFSCNSNIGWLGTVRGRVGIAPSHVLFYATGGLAAGGVSLNTTRLSGGGVPPSGTPVNGSTTTGVGWTAGLGAEVGITSKWSAKLEWLYYDLGTTNHTVDNSLRVTAHETGSLVRIGLNRHF